LEIEKLFVSLALDAAKYSQGLKDSQAEGTSWAGRMRDTLGGGLQKAAMIGGAAILGVGAIIGGVVASGINQFVGFQNQMNEVFTLLPGMSQEAMDDMSGQVLQFSKDFAVLPEEVVPALYQSLSAGVPKENVFAFLETAQKMAIGGVTELETAVDGISSAVNAYGSDVLSAAQASDMMFTTVKLGKTTIGELSGALFNVAPTASSVGVAFSDITAQLAALTLSGTPTSVATTQIRAALVEASKGGTKLSNAIEHLTGSSFSELMAQGRSMPDVFEELRNSMPEQDFKDLFGSVEAMNAVLGVTGPNFDTVTAAMEEMTNSAGATDEAYETMNKGIERSKEKFKAFASVALIQVGDALSPMIDKVIELAEQALPYVESGLETITGLMDSFFGNLEEGMTPLDAFIEAIWDIAPPELLDGLVRFRDEILPGIMTALTNLWTSVQPVVETIKTAVAQFVSWQDVMIAIGLIIGGVVLNAVAGIVVALAPVIAAVMLVIGIIALLRNAWENNWGGIQEKTAAAWEFIKVIFAALSTWVTTVLMPVLADLWNKWVTVWWPAISRAISDAWYGVILPALTALREFITNTVIPIVEDLWNRWVNVWWPAISTALTNAWTIILGIWTELGRWINDNIVPWIKFLHKKWVEEIWPAIQKVVEDAWAILKPIWEKFREYLEDTLPPALEGLKKVMETVMTRIETAIQPVHDLWKNLVDAVVNFWNWITSHKFEFDISIPDLPDWAVPGSPLPIHTAWANFADDMNKTTIAPRFNLDGAGLVTGAALGGGDVATDNSSRKSVMMVNPKFNGVSDMPNFLDLLEGLVTS